MNEGRNPLSTALLAAGPAPAGRGDSALFGDLVGEWDIEWHGPGRDGGEVVVHGRLDVGWILDGLAVQDVWHVPVDPAEAGEMRAFHGTTVRFYDRALGAWRSTWLDPLNGRVRRFVGRPAADGIDLQGLDEDPREHWRFTDMGPDSFTWLGEESADGGKTWTTSDRMYVRRRR